MRYFKTLPDDLAGVRAAARQVQGQLGEDLGVEAALEEEGVTRVAAGGKLVVGEAAGKGGEAEGRKAVGMVAIG